MTEKHKRIQDKLDAFKKEVVFATSIEIKDLADILTICGHRNGNAKTYYKGTDQIQCYPGANRSTGDMYRIAKSYIKDITYEDVVNALEVLYDTKQMVHYFCPDVNKRVHYIQNYSTIATQIRKSLTDKNVNKTV